jgi:hypothetical protein
VLFRSKRAEERRKQDAKETRAAISSY